MQRDRDRARGRRRTARLQAAEGRFHHLLELLRGHVADGDDRHVRRAIKGVVERAQARGREGPQDLGLADRQPIGVTRVIEEDRDLFVADPRSGAEAAAPFLDDDAALLVDLEGIQRQSAGEVGECGQALLDDRRLVRRQVEHVNGVFEAGLRIHMRAEPGADRLEIGHQFTRLEVLAAVECHVLEHVRQPLLVIRFVERAGLHRQPQDDPVRRPGVPADVIGQPVRQRAALDRRVERQHLLQVDGWRRGDRRLARRERQARERDERSDGHCAGNVGGHGQTLACAEFAMAGPRAIRRPQLAVLSWHFKKNCELELSHQRQFPASARSSPQCNPELHRLICSAIDRDAPARGWPPSRR